LSYSFGINGFHEQVNFNNLVSLRLIAPEFAKAARRRKKIFCFSFNSLIPEMDEPQGTGLDNES
jgi:hypothetical protein